MNFSQAAFSWMVWISGNYSQEELRKNIGLVLQDPFLYHGTIKSNIAMYQDISDEEVQAAAAFVDADSFIQDLPQGYDAPRF